jgi:hypothetical protein
MLAPSRRKEAAMDAEAVRRNAEEHGRAVVEGDLKRAARTVDQPFLPAAGKVVEQLPSPLRSVDVETIEPADGYATVRIRYSGEIDSALVESRWEERDGEPKLVDAKVVVA